MDSAVRKRETASPCFCYEGQRKRVCGLSGCSLRRPSCPLESRILPQGAKLSLSGWLKKHAQSESKCKAKNILLCTMWSAGLCCALNTQSLCTVLTHAPECHRCLPFLKILLEASPSFKRVLMWALKGKPQKKSSSGGTQKVCIS